MNLGVKNASCWPKYNNKYLGTILVKIEYISISKIYKTAGPQDSALNYGA